MPDFERILDSLSVFLADTPESSAYAKGFVDGKDKARLEIVYVAVFIAIVAITVVNITF